MILCCFSMRSQMFSPIQIKHECTTVEDVSTNNRINSSDNSIYPIFVNHQDVEYKHRQLSQFWEQSQLSEDVHIKHDIHEQQAVYQAEVSILAHYLCKRFVSGNI